MTEPVDVGYVAVALAKFNAAEAALDGRASAIIHFHILLEREVDDLLRLLVKRPDKFPPKKMSFDHKIACIAALWPGAPEPCEETCRDLLSFNSLRHAAAHGDWRVADLNIDKLAAVVPGMPIAPEERRQPRVIAAMLFGGVAWLKQHLGPASDAD